MDEPHTLLTPRGPVTVAAAQPCDLDDLQALYEDAARWLAARDINQWQAGYFRRDSQLAAIRRGEVLYRAGAGAGRRHAHPHLG